MLKAVFTLQVLMEELANSLCSSAYLLFDVVEQSMIVDCRLTSRLYLTFIWILCTLIILLLSAWKSIHTAIDYRQQGRRNLFKDTWDKKNFCLKLGWDNIQK